MITWIGTHIFSLVSKSKLIIEVLFMATTTVVWAQRLFTVIYLFLS